MEAPLMVQAVIAGVMLAPLFAVFVAWVTGR